MSFRIQVVYKSGAVVTTVCESFALRRSRGSGDITGVEWGEARPVPLLFGLDEVAAIWSEELPGGRGRLGLNGGRSGTSVATPRGERVSPPPNNKSASGTGSRDILGTKSRFSPRPLTPESAE